MGHQTCSSREKHIDPVQEATFNILNCQAREAILQHLRTGNQHDEDIRTFLGEEASTAHTIIKLRKYNNKLNNEWLQESSKLRYQQKQAQSKLDLEDKAGTRLFKKVKQPPAKPLSYTTTWDTKTDGSKTLRYLTQPEGIDKEVTRRWMGEVYSGNGKTHDQIIEDFTGAYDEHMVKATNSFDVPPITAQELYDAIHDARCSASGLDGWSNEDLQTLSMGARGILAELFNAIEDGLPWPRILSQAKSVFLSKDPDKLADPM